MLHRGTAASNQMNAKGAEQLAITIKTIVRTNGALRFLCCQTEEA
jgi:hypothetical protein